MTPTDHTANPTPAQETPGNGPNVAVTSRTGGGAGPSGGPPRADRHDAPDVPAPEISDEVVGAYDRAYEAATEWHAPDEMAVGNPAGIRAGLAAVYPLLREQWGREIDEAIAAVAPVDPNPTCPHEWHGADGGACPTCGWNIQGPAPTGDSGDLTAAVAEVRARFPSEEAWLRAAATRPDGSHAYLCTNHWHGDGKHCSRPATLAGDPKRPRSCKYCPQPCVATPVGGGPAPDGLRPFLDLRVSGMLWLINATTFHPRGHALGIHLDGEGKAIGWTILGDGSEAWRFTDDDMKSSFAAAEETLRTAPERLGRERRDAQRQALSVEVTDVQP